jgi:hypothetical protein
MHVSAHVAAWWLLPLVALAAFWPTLHNGFIWDDDEYVQENIELRSGRGLEHIWTQAGSVLRYIWFSNHPRGDVDLDRLWLRVTAEPQYYPLTHTSLWIEYHLWGQSPLGYHLDNLILHVLSSLLLWRLLLRLQIPGAFAAALLFAVHPLQVESVAWATERKNVLSGLLYFCSLWVYLDFQQFRAAPKQKILWYLLSLLFFALALLSKTVTATLPAAVLVILWWQRGRIRLRDIYPLLPMFLIGLAMGSLTGWMEKHVVGAIGPMFDWFTPLDRICIAGRALWFYLLKLVWPAKLIFIYPQWRIDPQARPWLLAFALSAALGMAALWLLRRRIGRGPLAAMLFYAITLFPALGFVNVFPMCYSFVADHFAYLAIIGPLTLIAAGIGRYLKPRAGGALLAAMTVGLCVISNIQSRIFFDQQTLWQDTLSENPNAWMAWENYGVLMLKGHDTMAAQGAFLKTLQLNPADTQAMMNLGLINGRGGNYPAATYWFNQVLQDLPDSTERVQRRLRYDPYFNLGVTCERMHDAPQAIAAYRSAIDADPTRVEARKNLGNLMMRLGRTDDALQQFRAIQRGDSR